tara:strand:- start:403 stop:537 length:135 start_codon:yes stop_codon:yes gene_type:complete
MTNEEVLDRIKSWLDGNIEEQTMSLELRLDNARLRDKIEEWEDK